MSLLLSPLLDVVSAVWTLAFSLLISVATAILIDGVAMIVVVVWSAVGGDARALVEMRSAILRIWFSIFMAHLERYSRITLVVTGDAFVPGESALVVCNHRSWSDTVILYSLARQVRAHGDVKFLAKRSLLFFPVYGVAGCVLDAVIFIRRQAGEAAGALTQVFSSLLDPGREGHPYWLINYIEGTRFTPEKLAAAQAFAKKRDLKVLNHVLQPRTKGFVSTVHALRADAKAVYDVTIGYEEGPVRTVTPSFERMYLTASFTDRVVHVHQRRIPLSQIPKGDKDIKQWVYRLYEQKDALLEGFRKNGAFEGRRMRWNRITVPYAIWCSSIFFGVFALLAYCIYRLVP